MTLEEKEKAIIDHYGLRNQLKHLFSEIFELTEAIIEQDIYRQVEEVTKSIFGTGYSINEALLKKHTIEEFADVEHLLDQIALNLEIARNEVLKVKEQKADRQLNRIENGE